MIPQLHFKGSVLQHCSFAIGNAIEIWQFMKLILNLMIAESPEIYDLFKKEMLEFISQTEQRYSYLFNWLEFYDQRKTGCHRVTKEKQEMLIILL